MRCGKAALDRILHPPHPPGRTACGVVSLRLWLADRRRRFYNRLMASMPQNTDEGRAHHQAGRLEEAESVYRGVLESEPDNAEALHLMGVLAFQRGRLDAAIDWFGRAVDRDGGNAKYLGNLGVALVSARRPEDALPVLEDAVRLDPDGATNRNSLGEAYRATGRLEDAVAAYRQAVELDPGYAEAHGNLAVALMQAGRLEEALASGETAVAADPGNAEGHNTVGSILRSCGRAADAEAAFRRAVEIAPGFTPARRNLGLVLLETRQAEEAKAHYRAATDAEPRNGAGFAGLARACHAQGRIEEAVVQHRRAIELAPHRALYHSNLLFTLLSSAEVDARALYQEHRTWNQRHAVKLAAPVAVHGNARDADRRLRLGYVSADFRNHPVGRLALPAVAGHDRSGFEVFCYSQNRKSDAVTARFLEGADRWRETASLDDGALADAIRADGIDILVDLTGHTARSRLLVFARRPAPVQIAWLGYLGTTGLDAMDYLIGDPVHTPAGCEDAFSERILRMPHDLVCFDPPAEAPGVVAPPVENEGFVTFGVFNNPTKITVPALALWARVLEAVPASRLIMKYRSFDDAATGDYMLGCFADNGIDAGRIEFIGESGYRELLETYNRVDIALDTTPYSGTMTTLEALWMGVPVVAASGGRMVARSSAAHLSACGLAELVAADEAHYLSIARALAGDPARLARLRAGMRARLKASALCDAAAFVRDLEALYRAAWRRWCAEAGETGVRS